MYLCETGIVASDVLLFCFYMKYDQSVLTFIQSCGEMEMAVWTWLKILLTNRSFELVVIWICVVLVCRLSRTDKGFWQVGHIERLNVK